MPKSNFNIIYMRKILLTYGDIKTINIGDYIQSIAAKQFFDDDNYIFFNRDELKLYKGEPAKVIMNAWMTYKPYNWPPSSQVYPLFVALHINSSAESRFLSHDSIKYLKKYEPIGCRDYHTMNILKGKGVNAYFSGCLTTTLGKTYKYNGKREGIYIVDPLSYMPNGNNFFEIMKAVVQTVFYMKPVLKILRNYKKNNRFTINISKVGIGRLLIITKSYLLLRKLVVPDVLYNAIFITQFNMSNEYSSESERFARADELLTKMASAQYVITSRIHCALPCLGFETPVVYIRNLSESKKSTCRLGGLESLFNVITVKGENVTSNFFDGLFKRDSSFKNKIDFVEYRDRLINICNKFMMS